MATVVKFSQFGRELTIRTRGLQEAEVKRELIMRAKRERDAIIRAWVSRSGVVPQVETAVNGRLGAPEESVVLPGPIHYSFRASNEIAVFLVAFLVKRSPKKSGLYSRRHRVRVGGAWVEPEKVGAATSFTVVNTEPFSRKLEVGAVHARVPPHIYEDARQAAQARFGNLARFDMRYIELPGGYILKGRQRRKMAKANTRSSVHRAGGSVLSSRRDLREGEPMRYPSILVELR